MNIVLALILSLVIQTHAPQGMDGRWPDALYQRTKVARAAKVQQAQPGQPKSKPRPKCAQTTAKAQTSARSADLTDNMLVVDGNERRRAPDRLAIQRAIVAGRLDQAKRIYDEHERDYPGDDFDVVEHADLLFRMRRFDEMYSLLASYFDPTYENPEIWLRASLAAALKGEVYRGQREYCVAKVGSRYSGDLDFLARNTPQLDRPQDLVLASLIALAQVGNPSTIVSYWEEVRKLDPSNAIACRELGDSLSSSGDFDGALAAYELGLPRAGIGEMRRAFLKWISSVRFARDWVRNHKK